MLSFAYRRREREDKDIVIASTCSEADLNQRFYCPNPECDAHMHLCNLKNPDFQPYFRATLKEHRHIKGCCYSKMSFDIQSFDENEFNFEKATESACKPSVVGHGGDASPALSGKGSKLPPHTIKQIYLLAKSYPPEYLYNGVPIWKLLADTRSSKYYNRGIYLDCLVEGKFAGFQADKQYIRLKYSSGNGNVHYLKLKFHDMDLFHRMNTEVLMYKDKPIVVWGKWKGEAPIFATDLFSKNQLYFPDKE